MIILVWGIHFDVQKALRKLGRGSDFSILYLDRGFEGRTQGKVPVLPLNDSDLRYLPRIQELIEEARKDSISLVIETVYPKVLEALVGEVDVVYIRGTFLVPLEKGVKS